MGNFNIKMSNQKIIMKRNIDSNSDSENIDNDQLINIIDNINNSNNNTNQLNNQNINIYFITFWQFHSAFEILFMIIP